MSSDTPIDRTLPEGTILHAAPLSALTPALAAARSAASASYEHLFASLIDAVTP